MNSNVIALYRYANIQMVLKDVYEEVSNLLTEQEFSRLYEYATGGEGFDRFLFMDFTKKPEDVFRKGFKTYLSLKK